MSRTKTLRLIAGLLLLASVFCGIISYNLRDKREVVPGFGDPRDLEELIRPGGIYSSDSGASELYEQILNDRKMQRQGKVYALMSIGLLFIGLLTFAFTISTSGASLEK